MQQNLLPQIPDDLLQDERNGVLSHMDKFYKEPGKNIPVYGEFDVIVVGAGMAGAVAAIAAGRQGARTLLIERSGMLGGVGTAGMMASITNKFFNSKDVQIIRGIPEEIIENMVKKGVTSAKWRSHSVPQIPHNADVMMVVLFNMLKDANVRILLHTYVVDVILDDAGCNGEKVIKGLVFENKAGRQAVYSRITVDCSGDADIAYLAGVPTGYSGGDSCTVMFEMGNVDLQKTYEYYAKRKEEFDEEMDIAISFEEFEKNWKERGIFHLPHGNGRTNTLLQKAIKEGKYWREKGLGKDLDVLGLFGTRGTQRVLVNSNYYYVDSLTDIEKLSAAELEGRERCLELAEVLVEIMPGFEKAFVTRTASEIGVRLSRYIIGEYVISEDDFFVHNTRFEDAVCNTPRWVHTARGIKLTEEFLDIPYRSLLPKGIDNLLIGSGKCISSERLVRWNITRGQANTMLIGQAAGTAAAVAVKNNRTVKTVDVKLIQQAARDSGILL